MVADDGAAVKPVTIAMGDAPRVAPVSTFYGNKRFYVFFRVFALLCQRLRRAKELQLDPGRAVWRPFNILAPDAAAAPPPPPLGEDKYAQLVRNVHRLVAGEIDNAKFEDEVRDKFGLHSYVLFTLDRLVSFLCRRLTAIVTGDECVKLLGLWEYELKRAHGAGVTEPLYANNAREVVGPRGKLVRICLVEDAAGAQAHLAVPPKPPADWAKSLTVHLLPLGSQPKMVQLAKDCAEWSRYLHAFLHEPAESDVRARSVFLARNAKATAPDMAAALQGAAMDNGLRVRVALRTYRFFFVEGTEDYFHRPRARPAAPVSRARAQKFHAWLAAQGLP